VWSELAQDGVQRWENKLCTRKQMEFLTQLHFYHEVGCVSGYIVSARLVLLHLHEVYTAFFDNARFSITLLKLFHGSCIYTFL
jgi:hypothetical protein